MVAYRYVPSKLTPIIERVPIPIPAADEILIKVLAAGVCHSDVGVLTPGDCINATLPLDLSFTLGHEGAGIIVGTGSSVLTSFPELKLGDYIAIWCGSACPGSSCTACAYGNHNLCSYNRLHGVGSDGTWAEYVVLHASCAVRVPGNPARISPAVVSAATDAILTPYHAIKTCCGVRAEHTVLCMGIGGLGLNGVAIAKKCLGVKCVIACDTRQTARAAALAAGADYVASPAQLAGLIEENRLVVDFAFDFVGVQATFDACFAAIRPGGTIHIVGLGAESLDYKPLVAIGKDLTLKTSFWGTRTELAEVLQAIANGLLQPTVTTRPMSECGQVLDDMRAGKLKARVALVPEQLRDGRGTDVASRL